VVPIGEFGVLITGSTYSDSFGESERRLLETLSANVETTMRLTSRRRELELLDQVLARILRHNIRNVLTIIKGFARQIQQEGNREAAAHAQRIIDRSESLQSTAEHAREIRHIITNRERREEFPLQAVVERVVTTVRSEYPSVRVRTTFDAEPTVLVHPDLPVAVRHLVENGIEHAEEQTTPQIEITVSTSNDGAVLEIADNGPGIPDHEIEVLDTHGESALEHGSGAGLWLIDRIVNYSDATIEFDRADDGSVATITFEQA
jgi:signal transduction histidine kinase